MKGPPCRRAVWPWGLELSQARPEPLWLRLRNKGQLLSARHSSLQHWSERKFRWGTWCFAEQRNISGLAVGKGRLRPGFQETGSWQLARGLGRMNMDAADEAPSEPAAGLSLRAPPSSLPPPALQLSAGCLEASAGPGLELG